MNKHPITDHLGHHYDSIKSLCASYNLSTNVFARRKQRGWSMEQILTTPVKSEKSEPERVPFILDHLAREYPDLPAMCMAYRIDLQTFFNRRNMGWTLEQILTTPAGEEEGRCADHQGRVFQSVSEMCDHHHISYSAFYYRVQNGWSLERALTTPVDSLTTKCQDHLGQEFGSLKEMCERHGIPFKTYQSRIRGGWSVEQALTAPIRKRKK